MGRAPPATDRAACPVAPKSNQFRWRVQAEWRSAQPTSAIAAPHRKTPNTRFASFNKPGGACSRRQAPAASLFASIAVG